ncbi:hypothetical protein [Pseudomonas thivervalensis]|uniref:hypothetical protein n=1 Tax=Pseudomonas thivervalensis TaxID=86265 RepID=UPI003D968E35
MAFDKRTRRFIKGIDTAKAEANRDGIELTPEEASKLAMKTALGSKKAKPAKKKKRRGGWPFLPGSFESSSR